MIASASTVRPSRLWRDQGKVQHWSDSQRRKARRLTLKTTKALGLTIPQSLLATVDQAVE